MMGKYYRDALKRSIIQMELQNPIEAMKDNHSDYLAEDPGELTVFDMFLPPQAVPLLGILLIITPFFLLTAESLIEPLVLFVQERVIPGNELSFATLPLNFFIKFILFAVLGFLTFGQLLLRVETIYVAMWSKTTPRPHELHVDYSPDRYFSIMSLMSWKLYRLISIILPPILSILLTGFVSLVVMYFVQAFNSTNTATLSFQFTVAIFVTLILFMLTAFICLNSLWNIFITIFGDITAITEPDLSNKSIYQRANRIAFTCKRSLMLYAMYFIYYTCTFTLVALLLTHYNITDLIRFKANYFLIFGLEILCFSGYIALNHFKFKAYHRALVMYYQQLPEQLKNCFTPPPASPYNNEPNMTEGAPSTLY